MSDVTRLLGAAASGNRQTAADLLPLVYDALRLLNWLRRVWSPGNRESVDDV